MAEPIHASLAPFVNIKFTITGTQYYYYVSREPHGGLDLQAAIAHQPLYSMVDGTVLAAVNNHSSYGNYIIIQDDTTGDTWLYAHMESIDVLPRQKISFLERVGVEGKTGNVTGRHVHLEYQSHNPGEAWTWNIPYNDRPNVAVKLGLTNTYHLQAIYYGDVPPVPPVPPTPEEEIKSKFPWFIYNRKRRNQ